MTNICTDEPKNADVRTISVSLKNLPAFVLGDLNIIALCLRIPIHLVAVASERCHRQVYIDHGDGYITGYLHMTKFVVRAGQLVQGGELIGYVGSTGNSTGPHLHFAVRYKGVAVDPAYYLDMGIHPGQEKNPSHGTVPASAGSSDKQEGSL